MLGCSFCDCFRLVCLRLLCPALSPASCCCHPPPRSLLPIQKSLRDSSQGGMMRVLVVGLASCTVL